MYIYSILGSKYRSVVKLWWPKDSHHIGLEFHCMVAGSECYLLCTANAVVATFFSFCRPLPSLVVHGPLVDQDNILTPSKAFFTFQEDCFPLLRPGQKCLASI